MTASYHHSAIPAELPFCSRSKPAGPCLVCSMMPEKRLKKKIKQRLIFCRARAERHRLQKHDKLFRNHDNHHFHLLQAKRRECTKLFANGRLATNLQELLSCWKEHFAGLGRSRSDENDVVKAADDDIPVLHATSF